MKSTFVQFKINVVFFLLTVFCYAQDFYTDDLPPEFGLDDDPPPGAPIDLFIPIFILLMLGGLVYYFYRIRETKT
jgi:hypothetical protein